VDNTRKYSLLKWLELIANLLHMNAIDRVVASLVLGLECPGGHTNEGGRVSGFGEEGALGLNLPDWRGRLTSLRLGPLELGANLGDKCRSHRGEQAACRSSQRINT
jgi:hypothetical protein